MSHDVQKQPEMKSPERRRYPLDDAERARIMKAFTYHPVKDDQPERYAHIRASARELAIEIAVMTPPGRERALALTYLEQAVMWANAAIARGE